MYFLFDCASHLLPLHWWGKGLSFHSGEAAVGEMLNVFPLDLTNMSWTLSAPSGTLSDFNAVRGSRFCDTVGTQLIKYINQRWSYQSILGKTHFLDLSTTMPTTNVTHFTHYTECKGFLLCRELLLNVFPPTAHDIMLCFYGTLCQTFMSM